MDTDARIVWVGTVTSITQNSQVAAKLTCTTLAASFQRPGLRMAWAKGCPHALYDSQCKVDRELFKVECVSVGYNGNQIEAAELGGFADGWFNNGYIEWLDTEFNVIETRGISFHVGSIITLMGTVRGIDVGFEFVAFPGCERIRQVCNDKFDNIANYGGFAHTPGKSPFDGDPVF